MDIPDDVTKLKALLSFYANNLTEYPAIELNDRQYNGTDEVDEKSLRRHLKWMALRALTAFLVDGPTFDLRKAATWAGYIQGELRALGVFSIAQLREHTRNAGVRPISRWAAPFPEGLRNAAYGPLEDAEPKKVVYGTVPRRFRVPVEKHPVCEKAKFVYGCYFPQTDLLVGEGGARRTGLPTETNTPGLEWLDQPKE